MNTCENGPMRQKPTAPMGVGYEGKDIDSFVADLSSWGITKLFDVRLNPISRKPGFSKTRLREALASAGIEYVHAPRLGNPKTNRQGFWDPGSDDAYAAHEEYKRILSGAAAQESVDAIVDAASNGRIVLMCFEASERCCHRQFVLDEVKSRLSKLIVA